MYMPISISKAQSFILIFISLTFMKPSHEEGFKQQQQLFLDARFLEISQKSKSFPQIKLFISPKPEILFIYFLQLKLAAS